VRQCGQAAAIQLCAKLAYMDKQDERVRFMAKLPPDLHRWLKVKAAERGTDMNDLLVTALEDRRQAEAAGFCVVPECSVSPIPHIRQPGCPGDFG
jgi:hypothetical protein